MVLVHLFASSLDNIETSQSERQMGSHDEGKIKPVKLKGKKKKYKKEMDHDDHFMNSLWCFCQFSTAAVTSSSSKKTVKNEL